MLNQWNALHVKIFLSTSSTVAVNIQLQAYDLL